MAENNSSFTSMLYGAGLCSCSTFAGISMAILACYGIQAAGKATRMLPEAPVASREANGIAGFALAYPVGRRGAFV